MRRGLGFLFVGLGVFLIALAPLLRFYAYPALAKAPLDQDSQTVSVAPGRDLPQHRRARAGRGGDADRDPPGEG